MCVATALTLILILILTLTLTLPALTITLVDPLISHYVEHAPGCTYKDGRLQGRPVRLLPQVCAI